MQCDVIIGFWNEDHVTCHLAQKFVFFPCLIIVLLYTFEFAVGVLVYCFVKSIDANV